MKSSSVRFKRQRLMIVSSNVPSWPDVPAKFESLSDDPLTTVLEFVGDKSYRSFGGLNKHCREIYIGSKMEKKTFIFGYAPLSVIQDKIERAILDDERVGKGVVLYGRLDVLKWALEKRKKEVIKEICIVAGEEGRTYILDEVWNNVYVRNEGNKGYAIGYVEWSAARGGKLNVLKWVEEKGYYINEYMCANEAAWHGHLDILQWLREEKGFELDGDLYDYAIDCGQLHVMKWLKDQECPFDEYTFRYAAWNGNLNILQWLHNEGCPWPQDYDNDRIHGEGLKPEVVEWLHTNGYSNRIM